MTREDNEIQRLVRDRIIQGNREDLGERQWEDAQIRKLIKMEKILKIVILTPLILFSVCMMKVLIQGFMIWFGWL